METNHRAKPDQRPNRREIKSLALGLVGLLSLIVGFLLAIGLSTPVGVVLGCADETYAYGCGVPGFVLGIVIALIATPIFLGRYLSVKRPVLVVLFSTIALFLIYSLTGEFVSSFVTEDSLSWVILAYAIIYGLLFIVTANVTDSTIKLPASLLTSQKRSQLLGSILAVIALVIIFFMVFLIWGPIAL